LLLEDSLQPLKARDVPFDTLDASIQLLLKELNVKDKAPPPNKKRQRIKDPPLDGPRKPYRRYYSHGVEIRVGKQAEDNDELSMNEKHRRADDWWMHASGCPGSHIVVCCPDPREEVLQDAACLAARQSKCSNQNVVKVTVTQCRNLTKPFGAKPGLVQIKGSVKTITVDMKGTQKRWDRLDQTVLVN